MMTRIEHGSKHNRQRCTNILATISLAYRPLSLAELAKLISLPAGVLGARKIVGLCGSFLTITGETVFLIHQSAKEYLIANYESLQPAGIIRGHVDISIHCIDTMSSELKRNMYSLKYGFKPKDIRPPEPDPLTSVRYACIFWADHLSSLDIRCSELQGELVDDGRVHRFLKERFLQCLRVYLSWGDFQMGYSH